ncbi:MAG: hypothetical protein AB1505_36145 [Candidatus Latescibacterota bacterium]
MLVPLTPREIRCILAWKDRTFWPDEERVLGKLRRALEEGCAPTLSRLQVQLVYGWAEEWLGGPRSGVQARNVEEEGIVAKLRGALEQE